MNRYLNRTIVKTYFCLYFFWIFGQIYTTSAEEIAIDYAYFRKVSEFDNGTLHLLIKNEGKYDVGIASISINGQNLPASKLFTVIGVLLYNESFPENIPKLLDEEGNEIVFWCNIIPNPIPAGGVSDVMIKLAKPQEDPIRVLVRTLDGREIEHVFSLVDNSIHLTFVGFNDQLNKIYIYLENVGEKEITIDKVYVELKDVTNTSKVIWKKIIPNGKGCIVVKLETPLIQGQYIPVRVLTSEGISAESLIRVFSFFPIADEDLDIENCIIPYQENISMFKAYKQAGPIEQIHYAMYCPHHAHGTLSNAAAKTLSRVKVLDNIDPFHPNLIHLCAGGFAGCPEFAEITDIARINPNKDYPHFGRLSEKDWNRIQWRTRIAKEGWEPRPLYTTAAKIYEEFSGGLNVLSPEEMRLIVYYEISKGTKGIFYRTSGGYKVSRDVKREIEIVNAELKILSPLLKIGEPIELATSTEPLVEASTILCGDEAIVLILINHDHDFSETWPKPGEYFPCIPVTNQFRVRIHAPPGINIEDIFEIGGKCDRVNFVKEGEYVDIVIDGLRATRQFILTTNPKFYYDRNKNSHSDIQELKKYYINEFNISNLVKNSIKDQPDIQFQEKQHNFGTADIMNRVIHTFRFKNVGKELLEIKDIKTNSQQITILKTPKIVLVNETDEIKVNFDVSGQEGEKIATIYVYTNDPDESVVKLQIGGIIKRGIVIFPEWLYYDVRKVDECVKEIKVVNRSQKELHITKVESTSEYISVQIPKDICKIGGECEVIVSLKSQVPIGKIDEKIKIYTDDEKWQVLEVPVYGKVKSDIEIFPEQLFFSFVKKGGIIYRKAIIYNTGNRYLKISGIDNNLEFVSIRIISLEKGKKYEIIARLEPNAKVRNFEGAITIHTNDPKQKTITIPLRGSGGD